MKVYDRITLTMSQAVSTTLGTVIGSNAPAALTAADAELKTRITGIKALAAEQVLPTTGKTRDRDRVFERAAVGALMVARLVLGYARANGLGDLAAKVDIGAIEFRQATLDARLRAMQQVHDAAASVIAQLADVGVTAATLTDVQTKIDAAQAVISSPRTTIAARRVTTARLNQEFRDLREFFRLRLDPLMDAIRFTDPEGYARYKAARVVINLPGASSAPTTPLAQPNPPLQQAA